MGIFKDSTVDMSFGAQANVTHEAWAPCCKPHVNQPSAKTHPKMFL